MLSCNGEEKVSGGTEKVRVVLEESNVAGFFEVSSTPDREETCCPMGVLFEGQEEKYNQAFLTYLHGPSLNAILTRCFF